jgi:uncharacterized protein YegL
MAVVTDIKVNDEIGQSRVVWMMSYKDKELKRVIWFVTIRRNGKYDVVVHNSKNVLADYRTNFESFVEAVKSVLNNMKAECKTKHHYGRTT